VDVYSDAYWTTEFAITQADLDRLAGFITAQNQAQNLGTLIKRVVRGRLRHGHDRETAVSFSVNAPTAIVRLWDPAGEWQAGDHAIVARPIKRHVYEVFIGEVTAVTADRVDFFLPEENKLARYERAEQGSEKARKWRAKVREVVAQKRAAEGEAEWIDLIILEFGERIAGLLLQALHADARFVRLDGRYFLHAPSVQPAEPELHRLAWSLLAAPEPLPTDELLARLPAPPAGDAGLFGLYLALRAHPHWFQNTQPGKRPLWTLAGPPPGAFTPQRAAYDPDSYEILCIPGQTSMPDAVARLWEVGLLTAVI
jgi:hypothetical protein